MKTGDRFILRESGRRLLVAGGIVIDPAPAKPAAAMRTAALIDPEGGSDQVADALLGVRGMDELQRLAAHSGGGRPDAAVVVGTVALTQERLDQLRSRAEAMVEDHHNEHPLRAGLPLATLATRLAISSELAERLVEQSEMIERIGPDVTARRHRPDLDTDSQGRWDKAKSTLRVGLAVPVVGDLGLGGDLTHLLIRNGMLVRVSDDLVFLPEQIEEITRLLMAMEAPFTVAEFRDGTGLSRKYVVPILEWADREGLTIRRGDLRHLR